MVAISIYDKTQYQEQLLEGNTKHIISRADLEQQLIAIKNFLKLYLDTINHNLEQVVAIKKRLETIDIEYERNLQKQDKVLENIKQLVHFVDIDSGDIKEMKRWCVTTTKKPHVYRQAWHHCKVRLYDRNRMETFDRFLFKDANTAMLFKLTFG